MVMLDFHVVDYFAFAVCMHDDSRRQPLVPHFGIFEHPQAESASAWAKGK